MIPLSLLDLAPIAEGSSIKQAFDNSRRLAMQAEQSRYRRVWLAEHHGMLGVASSATAVLLGHIAEATSRIRIGAGGVMLPNHSPLVIAEQFGTLATLYPNRVDLGLGRAPGTDMTTARALRRNQEAGVERYPEDIQTLQGYLGDQQATQSNIIAVPGANTHIPIWLLGSSLYSAQLAAKLGLPYSFASHFAPDQLMDAIGLYRCTFQPSAQCDKPYVMAGVMTVVADTDAEANYLFSSLQQQFINLHRGANRPFARPTDDLSKYCTDNEKAMLAHVLRYAAVGSQKSVTDKLAEFVEATEIDELIVSAPVHDIQARLNSIKMLAQTGLFELD